MEETNLITTTTKTGLTKEMMRQVNALKLDASIPKVEKIARIEEILGYPICAAENREHYPCINPRGKGTDHLGEGRCLFHGGRNQSPSAANYKHGRYSKVKMAHPELRQKMLQLSEDSDVFDLREEILIMRAILQTLAEKDELGAVVGVAKDIASVVKTLNEIEVSRGYVLTVDNVELILLQAIDAVRRHVPDPYTRDKIAADLIAIRLPGSKPALIEGDAIELIADDD